MLLLGSNHSLYLYFLVCPYYGEALTASVSDEKTLTSPGYPLLAPASLLPWRCRWILKAPDDLSTGGAYVLKVTFDYFNLQKYFDKLTFHDGINSTSKLLGKSYTGTVHPDVIYSTGRHMFVDFSVEEKYLLEAGSFSLNFSAVVRGNVIWAFLGLLRNSVGLRPKGLREGGGVRRRDCLSFPFA